MKALFFLFGSADIISMGDFFHIVSDRDADNYGFVHWYYVLYVQKCYTNAGRL